MASLHKRRRIRLILVLSVALAAAAILVGVAFRDGINFFRLPADVASAPPPPTEVFRLGGNVVPGSLERGPDGVLRFRVGDGRAEVTVRYAGIPPDLFGEGEGTIVRGRFVDGVFLADELLARHDETYRPRELEGVSLSADPGT